MKNLSASVGMFVFCLFSFAAPAQDLAIIDTICPVNTLNYQSPNSAIADFYEWDFCTGELTIPLENQDFIQLDDFIPNAFGSEGMEIVRDTKLTSSPLDDEYFLFVTNRSGTNIVRYDFGNDLGNPNPEIDNLIIGFDRLYNLKFHREGNDWYALVANFFRAPILLRFQNSLKNDPEVIPLFDPLGSFDASNPGIPYLVGGNLSLDIVKFQGRLIAIIGNSYDAAGFSDTRMTMIDFGNSLSSPWTLSNTSQTPNINSTGTNGIIPLNDFKVMEDDGNWYAITCGWNNITHVNFGPDLLNPNPVIHDITDTLGLGSFRTQQMELINDGGNYVAYILENTGNIIRLNFGSSLANLKPSIENLGNFGLIGTFATGNRPSLAFDMDKDGSQWYGYMINRSLAFNDENLPSSLLRMKIPNPCNATPATFAGPSPGDVEYSSSGLERTILELLDENSFPTQTLVDSVFVLDEAIGNFEVENLCLGETSRFLNVSSGPVSLVDTWQWDFGDGTSSNETEPTHFYAEAGLYPVSLTVINQSGCINTMQDTVRVSNRPQVAFSIQDIDCATGDVIFSDDSFLLPEDVDRGARFQNRIWSFGDSLELRIGGREAQTVTRGDMGEGQVLPPYTPGQRYPVTLTVQDEVGCSSSFTKTISFAPEDIPTVDFTFTDPCRGAPVSFTDNSSMPLNALGAVEVWEWVIIDANSSSVLDTLREQNPSYTFANTGQYRIKLRARNSFACFGEHEKIIQVQESLDSRFELSETEGIAPLQVTFTNLTDGASTFNWDFGDGSRSTEASPTYTYEQPGIYLVSFEARNDIGCGTLITQSVNVLSVTSNEPLALDQVRIFPNPARDMLQIEPGIPGTLPPKMQIFDLSGRTVQEFNPPNPSERYSLDIRKLGPGSYLLAIKQGDQSRVFRFVKY